MTQAAASATTVRWLVRLSSGAVRGTVRSALLWTLSGQWGGYALQLATTIVLARLLQPADFGLVGMALTLTVFVDQFRTLGLSQAVIQRKDLTWSQVDALFWVNAGTESSWEPSSPVPALSQLPSTVGQSLCLSAQCWAPPTRSRGWVCSTTPC